MITNIVQPTEDNIYMNISLAYVLIKNSGLKKTLQER